MERKQFSYYVYWTMWTKPLRKTLFVEVNVEANFRWPRNANTIQTMWTVDTLHGWLDDYEWGNFVVIFSSENSFFVYFGFLLTVFSFVIH